MSNTFKMSKTHSFYLLRVIARGVCLLVMTVLMWLEVFTNFKIFNIKEAITGWGFFKCFSPIHIVWIFMVIYMSFNLFHTNLRHPGSAKQFKQFYQPKEYNKEDLKKAVKFYNKGAIKTALSYLGLNLIIAGIYIWLKYANIVPISENRQMILLNAQLFYFVSDFICVVFWCPFQSWMMKNRCCRTCRIFNWGAIMIQVPMMIFLLVDGFSFYALTLVILSIAVFLRWEIGYLVHPEYYLQVSNEYLSCNTCHDKFCTTKRKVFSKYRNENKIL